MMDRSPNSNAPEIDREMSEVPGASRTAIPLNLYRVSAPEKGRVVSNTRLTPPDRDDVCHIVVDLKGLNYPYLEGQSAGVITPGVDAKGRPNKLRLYSIASTRLGDDGQGNTASLCVKRVEFDDPGTGEHHLGVASNYLCDLRTGDEVSITGPAGKILLLPDDPRSNLILIATGTGIAPFRAFLRRIYTELPEWPGQVYMVFGVRTEAEYLYRDELESFRNRPGDHILTAFSREQKTADGLRMYVQHRLAEQIDAIWSLLAQPQTYIYICGLKGMEAGILAVLESHANKVGTDWPAFRRALDESGRLLIETY
jgi:ferredoxin--NADP+ reductase